MAGPDLSRVGSGKERWMESREGRLNRNSQGELLLMGHTGTHIYVSRPPGPHRFIDMDELLRKKLVSLSTDLHINLVNLEKLKEVV